MKGLNSLTKLSGHVTGKENIMKIVLLAPSHRSFIAKYLPYHQEELLPYGGYGAPFVGLLISELLARGHEVVSITTSMAIDHDYDVKEFCHGKFKWIVVPERKHSVRFNKRRLGRIVDLFSLERGLLREAVLRENPDFVHAHWSYEFAGCLKGIDIPHLVTVHDNAFEVFRYTRTIYRLLRLVMSELYLRRIKFASTVSPYMERYVRNRCVNVLVIPNPTVFNHNEQAVQQMIQRKVESLDSPKLIIVMNGWDRRKNGNTAIRAFSLIKEEFPNATLNVFGSGAEAGGGADNFANTLKLSGIKFHGPVDHSTLLTYMSNSHVLIHPSREESFGVVLIEAMAVGVPAIGGHSSGAVPWVIENPELLTDILNPEDIKQCVINLISNPIKYSENSYECYNRSLSRFSLSNVVNLYTEYYDVIIQKWLELEC
jgi:glycosyltransferase involved in cell wall biosynthesis